MQTRIIAAVAVFAAAVLLIDAGIGGGQTEQLDASPREKYVTITFDDAYRSQYRAAADLEDRGMRGVFFVPTGRLDGSFDGITTMTGEQVQDLDRRGHEIGGHTYNHADMATMTADQVAASLQRNRNALQQYGIQPVSFAYPYGSGVDHADTVLTEYDYARTVRWGINAWPPQEPGRLETVSLTASNPDDLDTYLDRMDPGDWLVVTFHHVDGDGTVDREQVDIDRETYEAVLDRIQQEDVTVTTFREMEAR